MSQDPWAPHRQAVTESQMSHNVSGPRGNTVNPRSRARQWCVTVNNYTEADLSQLSHLSRKSKFWIIAKEGQAEGKTPHLQAYFQFKNQTRFSTIKTAVPRAHIEKARGSVQQNYIYCSKEGDFESNITPTITRDDLKSQVLATYDSVTWKPWQQSVLDILAEDPDARSIHWIHEPRGNVGKSFLARYLACRAGTIISSGKAADIFNQVNTAIDKGFPPRIIICDVPRVCAKYVSYQALEGLKNGLIYSGKYEGGVCIFHQPHVICFANSRPDLDSMSRDRWKIHKIHDGQLFLTVTPSAPQF